MGTGNDLLSLTDVSRLTEVSLAAVSNWRSRHPDFPGAQRISGQDFFPLREIAEWLSRRKISARDRKEDEKPGTTYGDRFLSNLDLPHLEIARVATKSHFSAKELVTQVWATANKARERYGIDALIELFLALLYLASTHPEQWHRITAHWGTAEADRVAAECQFPPTPRALHVPLFRHSIQRIIRDPALGNFIKLVDEIVSSYSGDAVVALSHTSDDLLTRMYLSMRRGGDIFTPASLAKLMVSLVDVQPEDTVYDPFCRFGEFLASAATQVFHDGRIPHHLQFFGQAASERDWYLTKLNLALHGVSAELGPEPSQALHEDLVPGLKFDVVLANPPFNMHDWALPGKPGDRPWAYGPPPANNANFAWLQHVLSALRPGGRAAVLMANSSTTAQNSTESTIRARMVEAGVVDCVVALPEKLFGGTQIGASLWLLKRVRVRIDARVLFVDATSMGTMVSRVQRILGDEEIALVQRIYHDWCVTPDTFSEQDMGAVARGVSHTEIAEKNYSLNPRSYVRSSTPVLDRSHVLNDYQRLLTDREALRMRASQIDANLDTEVIDTSARLPKDVSAVKDWSKTTLGEICDLLAGPGSISLSVDEANTVSVVLPRNIKQNRISGSGIEMVTRDAASKLNRYFLAPGDIVGTRTGSLGRFGLVQAEQEGWLLGPGCMRIRPRHGIDPRYLTYYLAAPLAQDWIAGNATGSAVRHISVHTMQQMPVVVPPLAIQAQISVILSGLDEESALYEELSVTAQNLRDVLLPLLLTEVSG